MTLVSTLRGLLGDDSACSFQLMGEDLALLSGAALRDAAAVYEDELARTVPPLWRDAFEREQAALLAEAHRWLRKYNRSVHARIRGYMALGLRLGYEYPWPAVAILGICQVLSGMTRTRLYGLVGWGFAAAGLPTLAQATERIDDVLRRTNRGIFADSVPTVLWALRCHALRASGQGDLARLLLEGPPPPTQDRTSQRLAQSLYEGLAIGGGAERFRALSDLTVEHFAREQAIFTFQMGSAGRKATGLLEKLTAPRSVPAPRIERTRRGRRVVFKPYRLPSGFEMADHEARVREFGNAFVRSITSDIEDYRTAVRYVQERFGREEEKVPVSFEDIR